MNRKKLAVLSGLVLVLAVAGSSFALTGEFDFVSGYDEENDVLVYGYSETDDATAGCEALDGTTVSYGGTTTTTAPPSGGGCQLRVVEVSKDVDDEDAEDEGVVNHGQVVSSFVQDLKEAGVEGGIGCLVRQIAGSEFGKGDEETTSTVPTVTTTELTGDVDLTSETVTCGKPDHAGGPNSNEDGEGGPPEHAGRPDHAGPPDHAGGQGSGD